MSCLGSAWEPFFFAIWRLHKDINAIISIHAKELWDISGEKEINRVEKLDESTNQIPAHQHTIRDADIVEQ